MEPSSSQRMSACTQQGPTVRNPFYRFHTLVKAGWLSRCNHEGYSQYSKMEFAVVILFQQPIPLSEHSGPSIDIIGLGSKNRTCTTWSQTMHDTISPHRDMTIDRQVRGGRIPH